MNITDLQWWMDDCFNRVPEFHKSQWSNAVNGIRYFRPDNRDVDDFGKPVPYGTGPHCLLAFQTWASSLWRPKHILEIGFNCGNGSAALFSCLPIDCKITSIDIRDSEEVRFASGALNNKFDGRHTLKIGDSAKSDEIAHGVYDGAFIDGAHDLESIVKDIAACRRLGIKQFLFDDIFPQFGETLPAIKSSGLRMLAIVGANMAICTEA